MTIGKECAACDMFSGIMNKLFYGDNLDVMRKFIRDETVDLCYIDPPFNSRAQLQPDIQQHRHRRPCAGTGVYRHMDVGRPREPMLRRDSVEQKRSADAAVNRSHQRSGKSPRQRLAVRLSSFDGRRHISRNLSVVWNDSAQS